MSSEVNELSRALTAADLTTCRAIVNDQVKLSKMMAEYDFSTTDMGRG